MHNQQATWKRVCALGCYTRRCSVRCGLQQCNPGSSVASSKGEMAKEIILHQYNT